MHDEVLQWLSIDLIIFFNNTKLELDSTKSFFPPTRAFSAKANFMQGFYFAFNVFPPFISMFLFSLCICLSLSSPLASIEWHTGQTEAGCCDSSCRLVLPPLSLCLPFQTGEWDAAPPPLMTSCSAHARFHPSTNVTIDPHASVPPHPPKKPHLCSDVSCRRRVHFNQLKLFLNF